MIRNLAWLLLLAGLFHAVPGSGQVSQSATKPLNIYLYGTASGQLGEQGYGKALGGSGGIILQHSQFFALDFRGVTIRARQPIHTYVAEAGPRIALRYGRIHPYGEVLVGLGHSGYRVRPHPLLSAYGIAYTADFGADLRITHRLSWRVAEYSWSHISAGSGVSPVILNTGIVYRLF